MINRYIHSILALVLLSLSTPAQAQQYVLRSSVFSAGGQQSTGEGLVLQSTLGQPAIGRTNGTALVLDGGFWPQATNAAGPLALPSALHDVATTDEDTPVVIDVLANDTDPGGGALVIESFRQGNLGRAALTDTMTFVYSPLLNANGQDTFTYRVINDAGGIAEATVAVTIRPVNDAPFFFSTPPDHPASVDNEYRYRAVALDVDGDALTFTAPVLPPWLTLVEPTDSTATLAGTPTTADVGVHDVTLIVSDGHISVEQAFTLTVTAATNVSTEDDVGVPAAFVLHQNYPNPFNPTTTIAYDLPQAAEVRLVVYDLFGRVVKTLVAAQQPAGRYDVTFQADGLASGTYFYRIEAGAWSQVRQFVLLK